MLAVAAVANLPPVSCHGPYGPLRGATTATEALESDGNRPRAIKAQGFSEGGPSIDGLIASPVVRLATIISSSMGVCKAAMTILAALESADRATRTPVSGASSLAVSRTSDRGSLGRGSGGATDARALVSSTEATKAVNGRSTRSPRGSPEGAGESVSFRSSCRTTEGRRAFSETARGRLSARPIAGGAGGTSRPAISDRSSSTRTAIRPRRHFRRARTGQERGRPNLHRVDVRKGLDGGRDDRRKRVDGRVGAQLRQADAVTEIPTFIDAGKARGRTHASLSASAVNGRTDGHRTDGRNAILVVDLHSLGDHEIRGALGLLDGHRSHADPRGVETLGPLDGPDGLDGLAIASRHDGQGHASTKGL